MRYRQRATHRGFGLSFESGFGPCRGHCAQSRQEKSARSGRSTRRSSPAPITERRRLASAGIIQGGVKRVVYGQKDPNPITKGKGCSTLLKNKVKVVAGILEKECADLNRPFRKLDFKKSSLRDDQGGPERRRENRTRRRAIPNGFPRRSRVNLCNACANVRMRFWWVSTPY